jgi:SAM-dependent methyltransferase
MEKNFPADLSLMSEEDLYRLNIYHVSDANYCQKQLNSLYGLVNKDQDKTIVNAVCGRKVLDVGAGYGTLSKRLKIAGFCVTAIEPNPQTREIAKKWNDVEELPYDIYHTPFDDCFFDTVILRECVEHLDFSESLKEIKRICNSRVLVFQTNLNPIIMHARKRIGHEEYNPQKLNYYKKKLDEFGFSKQKVIFRDSLAFPLSGGYHAAQLIPRDPSLEHAVLGVDKTITKVFQLTGLASSFCWRYLLISDKSVKKN